MFQGGSETGAAIFLEESVRFRWQGHHFWRMMAGLRSDLFTLHAGRRLGAAAKSLCTTIRNVGAGVIHRRLNRHLLAFTAHGQALSLAFEFHTNFTLILAQPHGLEQDEPEHQDDKNDSGDSGSREQSFLLRHKHLWERRIVPRNSRGDNLK